MRKFIPDFRAIGKTSWSKPNLDTRNPFWWAMVGAALLMVVFVFIPWLTLKSPRIEVSILGITWWCGILGLAFALVTVYGALYNQKQFVFCGAVLAAVMGLIALLSIPDVTYEVKGKEITATSEVIKKGIALGVTKASHTGVILFLFASLVAAGASFLQIKKNAAINKTNVEEEIAIDESDAKKAANDVRVKNDTAIAECNNELPIKQAKFKNCGSPKFIPDFRAIGKTSWSKPNFDTGNPFWWVMVGAALLMVVFVFIPWQTLEPAITATSYGGHVISYGVIQTSATIGVTTWYGLLGLFFALVVVYGAFYNQKQYVFCGALLAAIMGLIGVLCTTGAYIDGKYFPAEEIISEVNENNSKLSVSHTGAICFLVTSLVAAATAFLQIKKEN